MVATPWTSVLASYRFGQFKAHPPIHARGSASATPSGLTPATIKAAYRLPAVGGSGTVAIIDAYDDKTIESDLAVFDQKFGLPACTTANGCFEKHVLGKNVKSDAGWSLEISLDVEWAHAVAPQAKILLEEAATPSGANLLAAIDDARARPDVTAVSMSWGGAEFSDETTLDSHFTSDHGVVFFASSGDDGAGASWPAASPNVVSVGGTSVAVAANGKVTETAWSGSGGGVSAYEPEPDYQVAFTVPKAQGHRAIPDVSYDADPQSGFAVYRSTSTATKKGWYVIGGTSAGAPQWAGIEALGLATGNPLFYKDKASSTPASYFRDIVSGKNGDCKYYCDARRRYDYVTGLGSPVTVNF
jgi:subtilase family serine protease